MNTLVEAWERTLRERGRDRAVIDAASGTVRTFGEIDHRAQAWLAARGLQSGALRGRAVVFALANGIEWLELFLAFARAGAVSVPVDVEEFAAEQQRLAAHLRAAYWWDGATLRAASERPRRFRDADVCLIKLTSGTTGRPRPLVFTGAQMLADARQVTGTMGISRRDLNHALVPLGHSYGLGNLTMPLIALGIPLVIGSSPLPHAIADDFMRWRPTVFPSVPAVLRALVGAGVPRAAFASLRLAISAGAPLPPEVARDFEARFGRRLHGFYGSSETGGIACDMRGAATLRGGVGRPLRGVTIMPQPGQRLRVCSAAVFTHGNPRRRGKFGCWSPPDKAGMDARGEITLLGRRGAVVKIAGRRVNLGDIAARLRRMDGVRDAWVGTDGAAEPVLGAAMATERAVSELRRELQADTPAWKIPKRWAVLRDFPLTARGKIDSGALSGLVFR
jgi:long-chain acyl-CoA synthetase